MFIDICEKNNEFLQSIDSRDFTNVSDSRYWKFHLTRDDNFDYLDQAIPDGIDLFYLDSFHNANHVNTYMKCMECVRIKHFHMITHFCSYFGAQSTGERPAHDLAPPSPYCPGMESDSYSPFLTSHYSHHCSSQQIQKRRKQFGLQARHQPLGCTHNGSF